MNDINEAPYKPSWIDTLIHRIDQAPPPAWVFYLIADLLLVLLIHATAWVGGIIPIGSIEPLATVLPIWLILPFAFIHYLDRVALQAMKKFRRALNMDTADFNVLSYQMSTMQTRPIWIMAGIGTITSLVLVIVIPTILQPFSGTTFGIAILLVVGVPAGWTGVSFIYHTVRQLRMVTKMYQRIEAINLFDLDPLHAFSLLTARTSFLLIVLVGLATVLSMVMQLIDASDFLLPLFATLMSTLAIATFFIPLWGIHARLVEEKQRVEAENNKRIESAMNKLHRRMDDADYDDILKFQSGVSGLLAFRSELNGVSTWPWQPATLRGLLSAVFFPFFLWAIQQIMFQLMGP
jgi:hypothetical protein